MPAFWLVVIAVTAPISSGPMNEVTLPVSANRPKILRDAVLRRHVDQQRARRRLQRPAGDADQAAEQRDRPLRGGGEQAAARLRRRHLA